MGKKKIKLKLLLLLLVCLIGVFFSFKYLIPLFAPFIVGYFFAWILAPIVKFIHTQLKVPKILASMVSLMIFGTVFIYTIAKVVNLLIAQSLVFLKNLPVYVELIAEKMNGLCKGCDALLGMEVGTVRSVFDSTMEDMLQVVKLDIVPFLTSKSVNLAIGLVSMVGILLIVIVTTLLLLNDKKVYLNSLNQSIFYEDIKVVTSKLSDTGIAYLKTQGFLILIISTICSLTLFFLDNKYALLIGISIGVMDALPLLGSGLVLVPWALVTLIGKDIKQAVILLVLYLVCQLIRQFLEPKLLGNQLGVLPLYTLMSMYVGLRLFGLLGFILGPIGLIVIMTIMKEARSRMSQTSMGQE